MVKQFLALFSPLIGGYNMLYIVLVLAFISTIFIILGVYNLVFSKRSQIINRLDLYTKEEDYYKQFEEISLKEFLLNGIGTISRILSRKSYMDEKKKKLNQAYVFMRVEEFIGTSILIAIGLGVLLYLGTSNILLGLIGVIIGFKLPDIYISSLKKNRMKRLNSQLPEALSIISNGLRAGFSFTQAMSVAANELESPIRDEFMKVVRDNSIGKTMDEALTDFSERTDDEDIDMFVTALIIQRKVGGNLTEVLDTIADTIRDRMRIRGEIKTLTAQGRFSALVISILPFFVAFMLFLMNKDYIMELFNNTIGIFMVIAAVIMQLVGIYIISKMANVEV
ncbi:type II secretion system F family protein [Tissierella creatinini]|nr:type II secretion system F family protein [Tissierella creatinini]TJX61514.1 type II secretion system F family protein [Soehngenia saccharolytica]